MTKSPKRGNREKGVEAVVEEIVPYNFSEWKEIMSPHILTNKQIHTKALPPKKLQNITFKEKLLKITEGNRYINFKRITITSKHINNQK